MLRRVDNPVDNPVETSVDNSVNNLMSCRRKTLHEGALVLALPLGRRADSHSRAPFGRRVRPSDARHHGSSAEEA